MPLRGFFWARMLPLPLFRGWVQLVRLHLPRLAGAAGARSGRQRCQRLSAWRHSGIATCRHCLACPPHPQPLICCCLALAYPPAARFLTPATAATANNTAPRSRTAKTAGAAGMVLQQALLKAAHVAVALRQGSILLAAPLCLQACTHDGWARASCMHATEENVGFLDA